ncbi:hypothetical protein NDU88_005818 [Pleurodeles waltl]|uniref:Uncharacterized protein n=1 Tax=Pleurodeles waltl TaxID=8319 RepID=A0AAV7QFT2_PLEWA|nr:hypothetical protein NDU88_005818 [Pleurodeles waltl]
MLEEDILISPVPPGQPGRKSTVDGVSAQKCEGLTRGHIATCCLGCAAQSSQGLEKENVVRRYRGRGVFAVGWAPMGQPGD